MKTYIFSSIFLMLALFSTANLHAQQINNNKNNYVVLTKNVAQLQPIILTAEALKAEEGNVFGDFQVVMCGKGIGDITDPQKMGKFIERAEKAGVQLVACGFSLSKFKEDKKKFPRYLKCGKMESFTIFSFRKKGIKA